MRRLLSACALGLLSLVLLPSLLYAAQDPDVPVTPLGLLAVAVLTPIVAYISKLGYDGIKTIWPWWDRQKALVHQVAAPLWSFGMGWLSAAAGVAALVDIHAIDDTWIAGLLNVLVTAGIKRWEKAQKPVDATAVMQTTRTDKPTPPSAP